MKKFMLIDVPIIEVGSPDDRAIKPEILMLHQTRGGDTPIYAALAPYRLIVVLKPGVTLADIQRGVVDVSLGWHPSRREQWNDDDHLAAVLPMNGGRRHSKLTVWAAVNNPHSLKMSAFLADVPRLTPPVRTQRTLDLSPERLAAWEKLGGSKWLYQLLDQTISKGRLAAWDK